MGNGLSISLRRHRRQDGRDELANWDTTSPLTWRIPVRRAGLGGRPEEVDLRGTNDALARAIRAAGLWDVPGFEPIDHLRRLCDPDNWDLNEQGGVPLDRVLNFHPSVIPALRLHLAAVFSIYQERVDCLDLSGWEYERFFSRHAASLALLVSFNYDLIAETLLERQGVGYHGLGVVEEPVGVPVFKPHGSIDYHYEEPTGDGPRLPNRPRLLLQMRPVGPLPSPDEPVTGPPRGIRLDASFPRPYDVGVQMTGANLPVWRSPRGPLAASLAPGEVILPGEASYAVGARWVRPGYQFLAGGGARDLTHCAFVGLSYWECDRPEIDRVLDALGPGAKVVFVNPSSSPDFESAVRARRLPFEHWNSSAGVFD